MRKRLFSILLAQCMVLCLMPTTAFAEDSMEETAVCTCEIACTEETMNTECPVCGAEGALAENCGKYVEPAAEGEASQPEGEKTQEKQDSDMPDTQSEAALAQMSGEGENGIAVQSAGVAIDNTNFPDANFCSFVASSFDEDNDNYLSDTEINAVESINCADKGISDLTGISHFTALETLNCFDNQLTSLDVSKNTALTYLDCYNNQLTSLDVSKNTALTYLDCDNNQLTSLDISNTNTDNLTCRDNIYQIVVDNDRTFDLSTLPGNFDVAKTSDWSGGKVSGNTLTVESGKDTVTYKYDCGKGRSVTFTLKFVGLFADYTKVDEAIAKANALNKDDYKDFTGVEAAVNAVVRGKNITEQSEVDAMAKAINDAIGALVFQLKIKYKSNGGTGTMANPAIELDKEFTFPECEYVAPNGKHFKGWQVDNTVYKVGDKRVFTKDDQNKEIKAVWEEHTFDQKLKEVNGVSTLKDKATCTTNAIYYKSCACGQVSTTETFEDKDTKLGHEYTKQIKDEKYLKSQGSNCQEHDAYWYACSRCDASAKDDENAQDKYYESAEVGNHVYDQEVESSEYLATPATCMTPARYYKSCICGAKGTEAFAATGTHLGHAYIEVKNPQFLREKATNCKEHDTYWYVCSRCGKTSKTINKYYEDKDSKGEHISSDWIIDQQPTVAKEGSKHKECTVCKEVLETEKLAKLENVKTETKKEETASKKETKVESKKAVTTGDNTNSIVPMALLGISLLGIYIIVMKKYVR